MEVIDLCDSDDDEDVVVQLPVVLKAPAPRAQLQPPGQIAVLASPRRKRPLQRRVVTVQSPQSLRLKRRNQGNNNNNNNSIDDDDDIQIVKTEAAKSPAHRLPPSPLQSVLEVFPDVSLAHAKLLLQAHTNIPNAVINALLLGGDSYPKEPRQTNAASATATATGGMMIRNKDSADASATNKEPTYNFLSTTSFQPSAGYKDQSANQLAHDFPFLTLAGSKLLLSKTMYHYAVAHDKIVRAITGSDEGKKVACAARGTGEEHDIEVVQFKRFMAVTQACKTIDDGDQRTRLATLFDFIISRKGNFGTNPQSARKRLRVHLLDPILIEEVIFVHQKIKIWTDMVEVSMHRFHNRKLAIEEGSAIECLCCYEQVAFDEMVHCQETHMFCLDCLARYAKEKVFADGSFGVHPDTKAQSLELLCFHGDGCSAGFNRNMLQKSLTEKEMEQYDALESQESLEQAGMRDTMCTCPKCGYSAALHDGQNVFSCPVEDCRHESCRKCREPSHLPLRCDEVEKKNVADGRARVEEAASNAVIRFCPKCKSGIIKSDGCNKMTCPKCKNIKFCYMCRAIVTDYTHFCQKPHCTHGTCKMCPLWTKDLNAIHSKEVRDAAVAEAARVEAESAEAAATTETKRTSMFADDDGDKKPAAVAKVHIDVESILQAPTPGRAR